MPITDLAEYKQGVTYPWQRIQALKHLLGQSAVSYFYSLWRQNSVAGAIPSSPEVCTSATTGALGQLDSTTGALYLTAAEITHSVTENQGVDRGGLVLMLVDRLCHQGGLSGLVTTEQTTNLPTPTLPRYTDGRGVWAALEKYTFSGPETSDFTVSYTNQDGTAGRASPLRSFQAGSTGYLGDMRIVPLMPGDTGVRSVESVTLSATMGIQPGNFGVTLFRPLTMIYVPAVGHQVSADVLNGALGGGLPEIQDGACLMWVAAKTENTTYYSSFSANVSFVEA